MPKSTQPTTSFNGVAAGQTATLNLEIGRTYHRIVLSYEGVTLEQLRRFKITMNGRPMQDLGSGVDIRKVNRFNGMAESDGKLIIDFDRHGIETLAGRQATAIGTGIADDPTPLTTFQLSVEIDRDAEAPALKAKALQSAPKPLGDFKKIYRYNYSVGGAGEFEIADLPRGDLINKVYFMGEGIEALKLQRDQYIQFDRTRAENELLQENGVRFPQPGMFVYDPTEEGVAGDYLATMGVQDLRFIVSMTKASNLVVVVEYLGGINT